MGTSGVYPGFLAGGCWAIGKYIIAHEARAKFWPRPLLKLENTEERHDVVLAGICCEYIMSKLILQLIHKLMIFEIKSCLQLACYHTEMSFIDTVLFSAGRGVLEHPEHPPGYAPAPFKSEHCVYMVSEHLCTHPPCTMTLIATQSVVGGYLCDTFCQL